MTQWERIEAKRQEVFDRQGGRCFICGTPLAFHGFQLAHRIPQRKWCIERWGKAVIDHPMNVAGVCGLRCNARAQLDPVSKQAEWLAEQIEGWR